MIDFLKRLALKILIAFLLLSITTLLLGCNGGASGSTKPDNVSDQHYRYALKAIEIADGYLDYEITAADAYLQISDLLDREDELPESEFADDDYRIESSTWRLRWEIVHAIDDASSEIYNKIVEYRNEIAEIIGEKKR